MKTLLLILFLTLAASAQAQSVVYKGGLISTKGPVPVGGDYVMTVNLATGEFIATTSVDGIVREGFWGAIDVRGRLLGYSVQHGYPIVGQFKLRGGYPAFIGRIVGGGFTYKVQAAFGVFP